MRYSTFFSILALVLAAAIFPVSPVTALILLTLVSCALSTPTCSLRVTTLSVPELLPKVLAAFKTQLFDLIGMTTDFSSATAVKGDTITGHIAQLPALADYDPTTGFQNGATAADSLLVDIPITLNKLKHVPVKIPFLTELGSKVDLVPPPENIAYTLVKFVLDDILTQAVTNVSNSLLLAPANMALDTFEQFRGQCNSQKMGTPRFCILNSAMATALGDDGRIQSSLFYGQLNGTEALRRWDNVAGFSKTFEYTDFPAGSGSFAGLAFDRRLACLSVRGISEMSNIAKELNIPEVMRMDKATDAETGLSLTAVAWQQPGTGDSYLSFAILYGTFVGTGGGSALSGTDLAGCLIRTQ